MNISPLDHNVASSQLKIILVRLFGRSKQTLINDFILRPTTMYMIDAFHIIKLQIISSRFDINLLKNAFLLLSSIYKMRNVADMSHMARKTVFGQAVQRHKMAKGLTYWV